MMSQINEDMQSKATRPFSRGELMQIKETLEQKGSLTDRLLFSLMLTGMRPSEYLPFKSQDLVLGVEKTVKFRAVSLPKQDVDLAVEILNLRNRSKNDYIFPSGSASNSPMKPEELRKKLVSWLKAANVSHGGRSPHVVRRSVIIAKAEAAMQVSKRFNPAMGTISRNMTHHYAINKRPPQN